MARILITRAPHQASDLADALRRLGHEPILVPTIEVGEPSSFAPLDEALSRLVSPPGDAFHWVLFTSANTVPIFERRLRQAGSATESTILQRGGRVKVAAIGPATARALASIGLVADLIPAAHHAASLAEALRPHVRQPGGEPTRMLLIRSEIAPDILPNALREGGAHVTIAAAYATRMPAEATAELERLFASPADYPAAIVFTSSSTASNLINMLGSLGLALPEEVLRISIGPATSKTLTEAGHPPNAQATSSSVEGLVAALSLSLSSRPEPG